MHKFFAVIGAVAVTSGAFAGVEKEHHFDVYVSIESGRLTTGGVEVDVVPEITPGLRIFEAHLGEVTPNHADEPGFYSNVFTPGASLGFNIIAPLRKWNDGAGMFDLSPETMTMSLGFGVPGAPEVTTPAGVGTVVPGFQFATADGTGLFDDHPEFRLDAPTSDGVYLLALSLTTDAPGTTNSKPTFILFAQGESAEGFIEDAEGYVELNMGSLPSPGGIAVLGAFGAIAGTRRRRD